MKVRTHFLKSKIIIFLNEKFTGIHGFEFLYQIFFLNFVGAIEYFEEFAKSWLLSDLTFLSNDLKNDVFKYSFSCLALFRL